MQCPDCGYMLTAFDKECPRCKDMKAKGISAKPPAQIAPSDTRTPNVQLPIQSGASSNRLTDFSPGKSTSKPLRVAPPEMSPVATEPAPLIIYTNRSVHWKPYAAAILLLLLLVGAYGWWRSAQNAIVQAMVRAAREGACERMPGFDTDRDQRACQQLSSALTYTITRDSDARSTVLFYLDGVTSSLAVQINKDDQGEWHAVSAKEGDEGNRHEYDQSVVPTWKHVDPPPPTGIGGPTTASPATPPNAVVPNPSPSVNVSPAYNTSVPDAPSTGPDYSITTQAGGGAPPDTSSFK